MPNIKDEDLVLHILNVGFGDAMLVEFPTSDGRPRELAVVDCYKWTKMQAYLKELCKKRPIGRMAFVCATHPHYDHVAGIKAILDDQRWRPEKFWDSGFRHKSATYVSILETVRDTGIQMVRVSSGMEEYFGSVRVTALSPSVSLRNRYATFGVDMNNASIVLRLENCADDVVTTQSQRYIGTRDPEIDRRAGPSVAILGGDAEFDSWAQISDEYRRVESTSAHKPLVKKMVNPLGCSVVKVSHHGSMHSIPLDVYERMSPAWAVISTKQEISSKTVNNKVLTRGLFPHDTAALALREIGSRVLTTDGSYEKELDENGQPRDRDMAHAGSVTVVIPPGGCPRVKKLKDGVGDVPEPLTAV